MWGMPGVALDTGSLVVSVLPPSGRPRQVAHAADLARRHTLSSQAMTSDSLYITLRARV